jgi:hypothetical protein
MADSPERASESASDDKPDVRGLFGPSSPGPGSSARGLSMGKAPLEQERTSSVFRGPTQDTVPLRLEEFEATALEREFWNRAVPLCRQSRAPLSNRIHPAGFEIELRGLRVGNDLLIAVAEVWIEKQYQNLDYLGLRLSGTITLKSFWPLKSVNRSSLRSEYLEQGTRPKWFVQNFRLPEASNQLARILKRAFVPPRGSRLVASDLFGIFKDPERAWKKEDLEWTGKKLILHPTFWTQVAVTRSGPIFDEELYRFLQRFPLYVERSQETKAFEVPSERVEWARYEWWERKLQKSITDEEQELRNLVARQKAVGDALRSSREALERHMAKRPKGKG